ncbi:MAG: hypothetical protein RLZZ584_2310, partial [Pseudomonadota bacterium]
MPIRHLTSDADAQARGYVGPDHQRRRE